MKLQRLVFENLGGFQGKVDEPLENFDFTYFSGQIGSGKSSIPDTISWVLFDQTIRGFTKSEWVNDSCESGYAKLFLRDGDYLYSIKRFRNKNTCLLEVERANVKKGEGSAKENLTRKTVQETQEFIEKEVLCTTFDVFRNSVMFGQNDILTLAEGTDKDRKQIVGDILGFEGIDACCVNVRAKMAIVNTNLTLKKTVLESKERSFEALSGKEEDILEVKKTLALLEKDQIDRNNFIEETNKIISEAAQMARLKDLKQTIRVKSQELLEVEKNVAGIDVSSFGAISEHKQTVEQLIKDKSSLDVEIRVASQTLNTDKKQLLNLTSFKGKCPLDPSVPCTQDRTGLIADLQVKILNDEERIRLMQTSAEPKIREDLQKFSIKVKELLDAQVEYNSLSRQKKEYEEFIDRLIKERDTLSVTTPSFKDGNTVELLQVQLKRVISDRAAISVQISALSRQIGGYEERLKTKKLLEAEIAINKNEIKDNYFILQHLSFLEELLSLKGVKNRILDRVIPFMQQEVNNYLSILLPNVELDIATVKQGKTVLKQELTFNIKDLISNVVRDFKGWSGGQKKLISLALRLGLWKTAFYYSKKKFEFLFLDEVFGALDPKDREVPLSFLKRLQEELNIPIVVIDHIEELKEEFRQIISFVDTGSKGCSIVGKEGF
jgi:DNA repair exonuclease SbcCD ATPase subunit